MTRRPRGSTLFPYTTLFRSRRADREGDGARPHRDAGEARLLVGQPGEPVLPVRERRRAARAEAADGTVERRLRVLAQVAVAARDRKSTRLNSSHGYISYAVF